jgi:competence protein ComEC
LFAQFARPPAPLNPGEYDWAAHERRHGRLTELYCDNLRCVKVVEPAANWRFDGALHAIRSWCERQLTANVAPRDAPIVLATLLGDGERLSDETKDAFLETGSIHLLVISGTHIAMLAGIVWQLARGAALPAAWRLAATVTAVTVYAAIAGTEPSVLRAAILTLATLVAISRGRVASAGNLLGAAALAVMVVNPCEIFSSGAQFSFIAVAVLAGFAQWQAKSRRIDPLERLIDEARPWPARFMRRLAHATIAMTAASLAVGVAIAPLAAHHFHLVTPASILLTPLAWPLMFVALASGFGVLTIGWFVPPLGQAFGAACGWSLHATEQLVTAAQAMPYGYGYCAGPPAWWLLGFYGALGVLAVAPRLRPRLAWQASALCLWTAAGVAAPAWNRPAEDQLRCTFLGMGHGLCAVLELPGGETILYDAGNLGSPDLASRTVASYLWSRGIDRIDAVILSHADIDHYNGIPGLARRFPIGVAYVSPMMFDPIATDGRLTAPNYLREVLQNDGVPMREIWMGDRLRTADPRVAIGVLHPPREGVFGRDNANSLLVLVEYQGTRILLTGDLESPGIERVMADPPADCDILLAPHHGSANSDPPGFAAWCTPEWVVMSGEQPERTLSTNASYNQAGASVVHTALSGAVSFLVDGTGIAVRSHRAVGSVETE